MKLYKLLPPENSVLIRQGVIVPWSSGVWLSVWVQ